MCKFSREMNHAVQNYVSANLTLWTMKNCAKIVLILQCCNSALLGRFVLKNHTYVPKLIYFQNLLEFFAQDVTSGGCLSKYRRAFIVYMFRRPPEVWSLVSDNASISGTGKASMATFPPTGPPPNQYRGPQMGYQFQNTLPPQVPMYPNFPRPAGPTSVPPNTSYTISRFTGFNPVRNFGSQPGYPARRGWGTWKERGPRWSWLGSGVVDASRRAGSM